MKTSTWELSRKLREVTPCSRAGCTKTAERYSITEHPHPLTSSILLGAQKARGTHPCTAPRTEPKEEGGKTLPFSGNTRQFYASQQFNAHDRMSVAHNSAAISPSSPALCMHIMRAHRTYTLRTHAHHAHHTCTHAHHARTSGTQTHTHTHIHIHTHMWCACCACVQYSAMQCLRVCV